MNTLRASIIIDKLSRMTIANGCTLGEAATAAALLAHYTKLYGNDIPNEPSEAPIVDKAEPPVSHQPSEAECAVWNAQFGFTPYPYTVSKRRFPQIKSGAWIGFLMGGFWLVVAACLISGL